MDKSLTPLIISFAAIILLTFIVINSRTVKTDLIGNENEVKNVLSLSPKTKKKLSFDTKQSITSSSERISPDITALIERSKKNLANGNVKEAEDALKTVLVFEPSEKTALSLLGSIYFRSGKYLEAEELFKRLATIEEFKNPIYLNHLASAIAKQGRYRAAIELCLRAQELDPDFADAYLNASAIYAALGEKENSSRHMFSAYKIIGSGILSYSLDPIFDSVRSMPEFQELISKAKKDWEERNKKEDPSGIKQKVDQIP